MADLLCAESMWIIDVSWLENAMKLSAPASCEGKSVITVSTSIQGK